VINNHIKMPSAADLIRAAIAEVEKQISRKAKGTAARALFLPIA
jgi:hypothetical protein